jgi:hypothetical protein
MPPFFAEAGIHRQPSPFERLDAHINGPPARRAAFRDGLAAGQKEGFDAGGPFADDTDMRSHWAEDWTNEAGRGGRYWPYLTDVDVAQLLADALTRSVQLAHESGKLHNTVWLPHADVPDPATRGEAVAVAEQERLFRAAVYESPEVVTLVILTPQPMSDAGSD